MKMLTYLKKKRPLLPKGCEAQCHTRALVFTYVELFGMFAGDDITVYGVMCLRWKPFYDGTRCDVELVLKANNIEVNNQHAAAALLVKDVQKEFEGFWNSYRHDPIAGMYNFPGIMTMF